jgi:hypothetical protein
VYFLNKVINVQTPRTDAMSLNIDRLSNAEPIYAGASRDAAHRPADDHHGGSSILSQHIFPDTTLTSTHNQNDDLNLDKLLISDSSIKKKKKIPKATFNWKERTEKFVKKAINLLSEGQNEDEVENWLKKKTGASLCDLYKDIDFLCFALDTPDLFDKILNKGKNNNIFYNIISILPNY